MSRRRTRRSLARSAVIGAAAVVCWAPIWFMLVVASRDSSAATGFPPPLLPGGALLANCVSIVLLVAETVSYRRR